MGGVFAGAPRLKGKSRPVVETGRLPKLPKLDGVGLELDSVEARRLQLWGERLIADIAAWRHREARRREGTRGVFA